MGQGDGLLVQQIDMQKVIPKVRVRDLPFVSSMRELTLDDRRELGIVCSTGITENAYRIAFAMGQGGSTKEDTWNKPTHEHTCCHSKVPWRHKAKCPGLNF